MAAPTNDAETQGQERRGGVNGTILAEHSEGLFVSSVIGGRGLSCFACGDSLGLLDELPLKEPRRRETLKET